MTNREFFEVISNGMMNEDVQAHAAKEIQKMNDRNAQRATTPSKTAVANEPIKQNILAFLAEKNELILSSVVGENCEITTAKASALLKQLAAEGKVTREEVKVPKVGKRMAWKIN